MKPVIVKHLIMGSVYMSDTAMQISCHECLTNILFYVVKSSSYTIYLLDLANVSNQKHMLMQSDTIQEQCRFLRFLVSY